MNKIKPWAGPEARKRLFPAAVVFLTALAAFGLGRLSVSPEKAPITVGYFDSLPGAVADAVLPDSGDNEAKKASNSAPKAAKTPVPADPQGQGSVFASKSGTKYYPKGCKGGNRVAEANRIWFGSPAEAEKLGLTLGTGCKL